MLCLLCEKKTKNPKFCCSSCAAKYNNKKRKFKPSNDKRIKIIKCRLCQNGIKRNIRANNNNCICNKCKYKRKEEKIEKICVICKKMFLGKRKLKTKVCSKKCYCYRHSLLRQKIIKIKGTNNFSTKQEIFSYKYIKNIKCDSKLEKAAIIYLVDYFKAEKIERYKNLINFNHNNKKRTFNPDFFVIKNNQIYIIEVKMKWSKTSKHIYNYSIKEKKKALNKFCKKSNYKMIWLDFDYDKKFLEIYNNVGKAEVVEAPVC